LMRLLWHNAGHVLWGWLLTEGDVYGSQLVVWVSWGLFVSLFGCTGCTVCGAHCLLGQTACYIVCCGYVLVTPYLAWLGLGCSRGEAGAH